jgi:hypothetical protein
MPIYRMTEKRIEPIPTISFADAGIQERSDLQRLLRDQIELIAPDTLVIGEEFGDFDGSSRRIDLLAVDSDGNLVVIELKRTEDGVHMELQAIRYAAMVSTMTFDQAVSCFEAYLQKRGQTRNARGDLLAFLEWEDGHENVFGEKVKVILASADFSQEVTTTVLWLNAQGLDIRCVRLRPYGTRENLLLDVQQVIPLPEAADYQVKVREKQQQARSARESSGQTATYSLTIQGQTVTGLSRRGAVLKIAQYLCENGISPQRLLDSAEIRQGTMFRSAEGDLDSAQFVASVTEEESSHGRSFVPERYFVADEELIHFQGKTYALMRRWGLGTVGIIPKWKSDFSEHPFDLITE